MTDDLNGLIDHARIAVCCGAGGVGKTTVATGIALAAARRGRKVLALTVDPSRRLAETLGVRRNLPAPVPVPRERLVAAGITEPVDLDTWMLDPQLVADRVVRRFASSPEQQRRLMDNRVYRQVSRMVAGMQEYTAMEAVHGFMDEGRYDLLVLDTPPSRHALDFLEGPRRLQRFFDGRIFRLFIPAENASPIRRAATRLIGKVLGVALGPGNYEELQEFFVSFSELFSRVTGNAARMQEALADPETVGFLLVTSVAPEARADALFFRRKTAELGMPFAGFLLNRSQARLAGRRFPDESVFGGDPTPVQRSALAKLQALAEVERAEMERDQGLLEQLRDQAGEGSFAVALPDIPGGAHDLRALMTLSEALVEEEWQGTTPDSSSPGLAAPA